MLGGKTGAVNCSPCSLLFLPCAFPCICAGCAAPRRAVRRGWHCLGCSSGARAGAFRRRPRLAPSLLLLPRAAAAAVALWQQLPGAAHGAALPPAGVLSRQRRAPRSPPLAPTAAALARSRWVRNGGCKDVYKPHGDPETARRCVLPPAAQQASGQQAAASSDAASLQLRVGDLEGQVSELLAWRRSLQEQGPQPPPEVRPVSLSRAPEAYGIDHRNSQAGHCRHSPYMACASSPDPDPPPTSSSCRHAAAVCSLQPA